MPNGFQQLPNMHEKLWALLDQVPRGRVTTYGRLATALGNVIASRWIGHVMSHHDHSSACVCHRVVRATGELGGHVTGSAAEKGRLLAAEGVGVCDGRVRLSQYCFDNFESDQPLYELKELQRRLLGRLTLDGLRKVPDFVAGVDVSYTKSGDGVAAYALIDTSSGSLAWHTTCHGKVKFPYITSYLAFREMPILLDLIIKVRDEGRLADVIVVDGSGILHPRNAGIATLLGIVADVATIGLTKKLLCGSVKLDGMQREETRPVVHDGREIGTAIRPNSASKRPVFVSPGHRIDVATAAMIVQNLLLDHRTPEPIYWADRLSRREARTTPGL